MKPSRGRVTALRVAVALVMTFPALASAQVLRDPLLQVQQVVGGLSSPTTMAFIGPDDILVLQKNDGRVRRVTGGVLQATDVLDVGIDNSSERGLLGIALHPAFPNPPLVYLYYTESSTGSDTTGTPPPLGNRVYAYTWNGSALVDATLILDLPVTPGPNHDAGIILFGPDGKLYVIIGDLNRNGQLQNNRGGASPDDTSVILRLNPDGSVPGDNPFAAQGGNLVKYYAYGIRNSFGMAFDPVTGKLWMTENGPSSYDEINLVDPGFNSGWNQIMGPDARDPQGVADLVQVPGSHYGDPKFSWLTPIGPTGIAFLDSTALGAEYANDAFVGDINNGRLYRFRVNASRDGFTFAHPGLADLVGDNAAELDELILGTGFGGITDLKVGPDGRLYVLSFGQGRIFVVSNAAAASPSLDASPAEVTAGSTVTAEWSGIASPSATDWIGLYVPGSPHTAFIEWIYVSCSKTPAAARASGSCAFTLPAGLAPGTYELRLLANNGFSRLATSQPVTVSGTGPTVSASPTQVASGGTLTAAWSGIPSPSPTDWIGLYLPGSADTAFIEWIYVSCSKTPAAARASGSCAFTLPAGLAPGTYELRLLANNGFSRLATSQPVTVSGTGPTVSASPTQVASGGTLTAAWSGIPSPSPTDWIGLYLPGSADTALIEWIYVSCSKTPAAARASGSCAFTLPAGLAPGTYELRLLANNGFSRLATGNPFTVTP